MSDSGTDLPAPFLFLIDVITIKSFSLLTWLNGLSILSFALPLLFQIGCFAALFVIHDNYEFDKLFHNY